MLNKLRKASSSHTQMYTDATPFEVVLVNGDFSPQIEFDGFTTELRGKWLAKSLFEAIITPFVNDLKTHLQNSELYISTLEVNDSQLPLRCKKGEGYRMAAGDFVGYNQEPGEAPRPVVVKICMWDARLARGQLDQKGHLFRICLGDLRAEAKVGKRTMGRSLARGVIVHFLKEHNSQAGVPQYTLADIRGILIGAMNDETADEEIQSGEGEMRDGIGEVQRTLRSPSSKIALPGGTILVLTCSEPAGDKKRLLGSGSSSPATPGMHASGGSRSLAQRMGLSGRDSNGAMPTFEVSVASLVLDLDDDDAEVQPAACSTMHPACCPLSPTRPTPPATPPATPHATPRLTLARCMTSGRKT